MKLTLSIGVRRYGDGVVIAQILGGPRVSAAAASPQEARAKLKQGVEHVLAHLHPRLVMEVLGDATTGSARMALPWYKSRSSRESEARWSRRQAARSQATASAATPASPDAPAPAESDDDTIFMEVDTDVLWRELPGGLCQVHVPVFDVSLWVKKASTLPLTADSIEVVELLKPLRAGSEHVGFHRPVPDEFEIEELEVEFTPLQLAGVAAQLHWKEYFQPVDLASHGADQGPATPMLEQVAHLWADPTRPDRDELPAARFTDVYHRDDTLAELQGLLEGASPAAVVIVGPARVGKTSLIKALARTINARDLSHWKAAAEKVEGARRVWFADPPRWCASEPMSPGWQHQAQEVSRELEATGDVMYLGRLVEALDAGKYVGSDYNLAQFLKPLVGGRRLRVVAEATIEEWNLVEQRDVGFARAFSVIRLDDPPEDVAVDVVRRAAGQLSDAEGIEVTEAAVTRAWALQRRFATQGSPVGRTIDFIGRTLRRAAHAYETRVGVTDVVESFCEDTGMPPVILLDDRVLDLEHVRARLRRRVMGQENAVARVAEVVGVTKAGLAPEERPLGSFLFVGMTGVGKTELARTLADYLFGDEKRLIRLDMSEYAQADAYSRLIGEGASEGELTGPVRRQPFCVVLLDEIEKAHANVFDLLLQVLGEARLTDVQGRMTRFQNTIIIMTSNLGVETLRPAMGFSQSGQDGGDPYRAHFRREAEKFFRPEFLARIDQFIVFEPLNQEVVTSIAARELEQVRTRDGMLGQDVTLSFGERVPAWVANRGFDPRYGARPIKRTVEEQIVWPLAQRLAAARTDKGDAVGQAVYLEVGPGADLSQAPLKWRIEGVGRSADGATRQRLLEQLEEVSELRRRLQKCLHAEMFSHLEWQVSQFDVSSQSPQFWQERGAAALAREAEDARRIVDPALALEQELCALEDLATEAYHGRSFDIVGDIEDRLGELNLRITEVFLTVLRSVYGKPDEVVLILPARSPHDVWRAQLVDMIEELCEQRDWEMTLWSPLPWTDEDVLIDTKGSWKAHWQLDDRLVGPLVALEIQGYAARALLQPDDGLHRLISVDGNAVVDVIIPLEDAQVPHPSDLEQGRANPEIVRVFNLRTNEVTVHDWAPVPFDINDPWEAVLPILEDVAWVYAEPDWY